MSVTFYCPDAPPCPMCDSSTEATGPGGQYRLCPSCFWDGSPDPDEEQELYHEVRSPHECNFSNANARNILALLSKRLNRSGPGVGGWPELYGEWSQVDLPEVQRTILQVSNVVGLREWMVTEPEVIQEPGRCTFIETGNTDEMTLRRLRSLSELVAYAAKNNYRICWS